jgi:hypothetical protein
MWLFTDKGFFSAVQKPKESGLTIRARAKSHLENLKKAHPELLKDAEIQTGGGTDYPYRIRATHETFAKVVALEVLRIDYGNYKNHLYAVGMAAYHDLCAGIWNLFYGSEKKVAKDAYKPTAKGGGGATAAAE